MHFFRALWANGLKDTGFTIINTWDESLYYDNIVIQKDNFMKFLTYPDKLGIGYFSREPSTYIGFLEKDVYFDKNGYFDPSGITWEGIIVL